MIHAYDVRLQRGEARITVRVAAVDSGEARAQALHYSPQHEVVAVRRSQYAIGETHRAARRKYLEASR